MAQADTRTQSTARQVELDRDIALRVRDLTKEELTEVTVHDGTGPYTDELEDYLKALNGALNQTEEDNPVTVRRVVALGLLDFVQREQTIAEENAGSGPYTEELDSLIDDLDTAIWG